MPLLIVSFIAGLLTVLAPCILPVLPIILGGSVIDRNPWRPLVITVSLCFSILVFTLVLKASTVFISIPQLFWQIVAGGIIFLFGIFSLFPNLWTWISLNLKFSSKSEELLHKTGQNKSLVGTALLGASLGPVFASCSPTYFIILATVLPVSFFTGLLYLLVYVFGLAIILFLIAYFGQKFTAKLRWFANPQGYFKKGLGIFFILLGLSIALGYEKQLEAYILEKGFLDVTKIEEHLLESQEITPSFESEQKETQQTFENIMETPILPVLGKAPEIQGIEGWINSEGETLANLKGKVVLIDFWTYSCINCIRTLPYLTSWDEKYSQNGLVILGIHAPEFVFERDINNVKKAVDNYNIQYPVGLDNDFKTWRAYDNRYWPAKYIIDKNGNLRYYHFGEGKYEETEEVIMTLLEEAGYTIDETNITEEAKKNYSRKQTPETYLNYGRMKGFVNLADIKKDDMQTYIFPEELKKNQWSLSGKWMIEDERSVSLENNTQLRLQFNAKDVFLVMGAKNESPVTVKVNNELLNNSNKGSDIQEMSQVKVQKYDLYKIIESDTFLENALLEITFPEGVEIYAFTFGS